LIGDIAGIATAVGVLIAAAGVLAQTRARKFGLAQVYSERYWQIDDHLLQEDRRHPGSAIARRYLRLCEDEFDAARLGWVDRAVWDAWHTGIRSQICELGLKKQVCELELENGAAQYAQLRRCLLQSEHIATNCKGLGEARWRRKILWRLESPLGA
jgi:hypothetical protein